MRHFKNFIQTKFVLLALAVGLVYPFLMIGSLLPGYSAYPEQAENMHVSIINEDETYGEKIAASLQEDLPFKQKSFSSLEEAKEALEDEELDLIIHIPAAFTETMTSGKALIHYYKNDAIATLASSTVQTTITETDRHLNEYISELKASTVLQQMQVPEEQANEQASAIVHAVEGKTEKLNETPKGMHNNMAPLMLSMSSYVVALVGSLLLYFAYQTHRDVVGKWKAWLHVEVVALIVSLVAPLVGTGILFLLTAYDGQTFINIWVTLSTLLFASFQVNLTFVVLLGISGMSINLGFMFIQIISSGALLSRNMMHKPFEIISYASPMYYSVDSLRQALFADKLNISSLLTIGLIGLIASVLIACLIALQKLNKTKS